mgnify:CR=1 FL=1
MVREGYKKTDFGEIPEEWKVVRIGDILSEVIEPIRMRDDDIYRLISIRRRNGGLFERTRLPGKKILTKDLQRVIPGTFIIANRQIVHGACAYVTEDYADAAVSSAYTLLKGRENCDIRYFSLLAKTPLMYKYFLQASQGVVLEKMNFHLQEWLNLPIPLPPIIEQRRISAILSSLDEMIEKIEALINKLVQVKIGVMQDLFTKGIDECGRIRSEATHAFKDSPLGRIPVEWECPLIGDIYSELTTGSTPSRDRPDYFCGDILWVTSGELKYEIIRDTKEKITQEAVEDTHLRLYEPGTFFIAITGLEAEDTLGSCAIIGKYATTNQSCMAFPENIRIHTAYLFQYYRYFGKYLIYRYAQGTKQQSLNSNIVKAIPIKVPPKQEQIVIAENLTVIDDNIRGLRDEKIKSKMLRNGLMADLLMGRVRVRVGMPDDVVGLNLSATTS